jgi:hypothetical protein
VLCVALPRSAPHSPLPDNAHFLPSKPASVFVPAGQVTDLTIQRQPIKRREKRELREQYKREINPTGSKASILLAVLFLHIQLQPLCMRKGGCHHEPHQSAASKSHGCCTLPMPARLPKAVPRMKATLYKAPCHATHIRLLPGCAITAVSSMQACTPQLPAGTTTHACILLASKLSC